MSTVVRKGAGKKTEVDTQELFNRIKQCVAAGDIATAESLREVLLNSDSAILPLNEIVASAELIEDAKLAGIDKEHLRVWGELYDSLSSVEKGAFFYALEKKTYPQNDVLIRQGRLNDTLFFIENGHLSAIFTKEKIHNLVLQVGKGGFVGEDTFFGMTVCTSSVVARSELVVRMLKKESMREWEETVPGLYAKLESYCRVNNHYAEAFEQKRQEKSRFLRLKITGLVQADILDPAMKKTGKQFKAAVADISRGGTCFYIKSSKKETARTLLAKPLQMLFSVGKKASPVEFMAVGRVVKIQFHLENDYSVHVKFSSPLGKDKIDLL